MPSVKQTAELLAHVTGEPLTRVNQIARRLIDAEFLPKSVGKQIAQVEPIHVALLLFVIAHAGKIVDAPKVARGFERLPYKGPSSTLNIAAAQNGAKVRKIGMPAPIEPNQTLGQFLALLLSEQVDELCELKLSRGSDGALRGFVTFSGAGVEHTHNFYHEPGTSGGWSFTLDPDGFNALREFLPGNGGGDG